ncbi:MAG: response regulator transcription factor [Chloroflexi bacterium]|nr:response regulator transcription factor [Chloroflexota bacterium]
MDERWRAIRVARWKASVRAFREAVRLYGDSMDRVQRARDAGVSRAQPLHPRAVDCCPLTGSLERQPSGRPFESAAPHPHRAVSFRPEAAPAASPVMADGQDSSSGAATGSVALEVWTRKQSDGTTARENGRRQAAACRALTPRQCEVAVLIARGLTNGEIAKQLVLTSGTVANHVEHMFQRLGYRSRAQIAAWAVREGLGEDDVDTA